MVDKLLYYKRVVDRFHPGAGVRGAGERGGRGALYQGCRHQVQEGDHTRAGYVRYHISVIHIYLYM